MIDPGHPRLSIVRQCELASISRSSFYREPTAETEATLRLMLLIDEQFLETPWYGSRQMARHLRRNGWCVGRHRVRRLMSKMGLAPIYQRPKTSEPHPQHRIWPYLLRHLTIDRPNQCLVRGRDLHPRCAGASCISSRSWTGSAERFWRGGCRTRWMLTSASRRWRRRPPRFGRPESSIPMRLGDFTSFAFTNTLSTSASRWMVVAAGLTTSSSSGCGDHSNTNASSSMPSRPAVRQKAGIECWIGYYDADRPHSVFGGRTPDEVYATQANEEKLAA